MLLIALAVQLLVCLSFFFPTSVVSLVEPDDMGAKHSTDLCDDITEFAPIDPVRTGVNTVSLSRNNITFKSSRDSEPVCAVGVGDVAFSTHGSRSDQSGIPFSWMNENDGTSLTKMLQIELYQTKYNIYDKHAAIIADDRENAVGATCTCPNGETFDVAARKPWTNCKSSTEFQCFGGTTGTCSIGQSGKFQNKVAYCGLSDAHVAPLNIDEIFSTLDSLTTPTRFLEGGAIEGKFYLFVLKI